MNINFIRKNLDFRSASVAGGKIIELMGDYADHGSVIKAMCYDPVKNSVCEICPEINKYRFISVFDCIFRSDKFYFASYESAEDGSLVFSVYRYETSDGSCEKILDFPKDASFFKKNKRLKVFILNTSNILVQEETLTPEDAENLMGFITFEQTLYNTETGENVPVEILDFKNNGINTVIPVSENRIMIKTGFSFMEDRRINVLSEREALIESIYLTSASQIIADITLNTGSGSMDLIETAYFDKCITSPHVKDDFVYYTIVDAVNNAADMVFVNYNTKERYKYRKIEDDRGKKTAQLVIRNTPYIKIKNENGETFLNLRTGQQEMAFSREDFVCSIGDLLVFSKVRHNKKNLRIYSFPHLNLVFEGRYSYAGGCFRDEDYYIYY